MTSLRLIVRGWKMCCVQLSLVDRHLQYTCIWCMFVACIKESDRIIGQYIHRLLFVAGIIKLRDMYQLYNDSDRIGQYILNLLNKFEVALQFDTEHLLLPSLLPTDKNLSPENMREVTQLHLCYITFGHNLGNVTF